MYEIHLTTEALAASQWAAFERLAAIMDGPFMLKGSYVSTEQIDQGWRRMPADLDWVGLGALDANELTAWVTAVTETECDDGVRPSAEPVSMPVRLWGLLGRRL